MASYDATGSDVARRAHDLVTAASADPGLQGAALALQRVCRAAVDALPVDGAVIHLMSGDTDAGVAASSADRWHRIGELVFTIGEGPCLDAARWRRPVLVSEVRAAAARWPGYASAVQGHEVAAVFAFPMQVGAVGFGVLEVYAARPGMLDSDDLALALALARIATEILLDGQAPNRSPEVVDDLVIPMNRTEIHQAQGLVMVALGITLAEAMVLMRARAFADDMALVELARSVISGAIHPKNWGAGND
jgi:hypothetical protein